MRILSFKMSPEVKNLGVKGLMFRIQDITNTKADHNFDFFCKMNLLNLEKDWKEKSYKEDLILHGFRTLHEKVKRSNRKFPASPEELVRIFTETGRFPRINLLVDIYNFISTKNQVGTGSAWHEQYKGQCNFKTHCWRWKVLSSWKQCTNTRAAWRIFIYWWWK